MPFWSLLSSMKDSTTRPPMSKAKSKAKSKKGKPPTKAEKAAAAIKRLSTTPLALLAAQQGADFHTCDATVANAPRLPKLAREVPAEQHQSFCARKVAYLLARPPKSLAYLVSEAEAALLKHTKVETQQRTWSNNFGNAMYCHADMLAIHRLCGFAPRRAPPDRPRTALPDLNSTGSSDAWLMRATNEPDKRFSPSCLAALLCREPTIGRGACWGSYGYAPVLTEIDSEFKVRLPSLISASERARPCGVAPSTPTPTGMPAGAPAAAVRVGVVYMRCGDYLNRRRGHVLLRLDWIDTFARTALDPAHIDRVVIVSNRRTHLGAAAKTPNGKKRSHVCTAIVEALKRRLEGLLGPGGPPVSLAPEVGIYEDLYCATTARVLIIASWGTSFGHWASLLSRGCAIVVPQLRGIAALNDDLPHLRGGGDGDAIVGSKHLEPIAWREGLHYVWAERTQWVHVADMNESVFADAHRAVAALEP